MSELSPLEEFNRQLGITQTQKPEPVVATSAAATEPAPVISPLEEFNRQLGIGRPAPPAPPAPPGRIPPAIAPLPREHTGGGSGWERFPTTTERLVETFAPPKPTTEMGTAERLSRHFVGGALGTAEGLGGAVQWITGGSFGKDFSDYMGKLRKDVTPEGEASFIDQLASGAGSLATFFIPGFGVSRGLRLLQGASSAAGLGKAAIQTGHATNIAMQTAADWLGASTMAVTEAATEAGQVYRDQLEKGLAPDKASSSANWTFWLNLPVLTLTDKFAFFGNEGKAIARVLKGMVTEGSQESLQEVISTWSKEEQQNLKNILTSGAVGAILGGGLGAIAKPKGVQEQAPPRQGQPVVEPTPGAIPGTFNRFGLDTLMGQEDETPPAPAAPGPASATTPFPPAFTGAPVVPPSERLVPRVQPEPGSEAAPTAPVEPPPVTPPPAPPAAEVVPEAAAAPPSPVIPPEAAGPEPIVPEKKGRDWWVAGINFGPDKAKADDFAAKANAAAAPKPVEEAPRRATPPMGTTQDNVAPEPKAEPTPVTPKVSFPDYITGKKPVPVVKPPAAPTPITVAGDATTPVPEVPKPKRDAFKEAKAFGAPAEAQTADGQKIPVQYAVVDQESLVVSHDTAMNENPDFPQEFQPRDRSRKASIERLGRLENIYSPEFYGATPAAWDGAPIVGPDMVVESGNGRLLLNRRGVEGATPKQQENRAAYQEWLAKNIQSFGISPNEMEGMKDPILVRVRTNEIDDTARKKLVRDMNISGVETSSEMENAVADGKVLRDGDLLNLFNPDMALNAAGNRDFRTSFINGLNPMDRSRYVSPNGDINVSGLKRIRDAVFAAAYGEGSALSKMAEETDNASKNVTTALMAIAPRLAKINQEIGRGNLYDLSFSKNLADAASILTWIKENQANVPGGMTPVEYYLSQGQLFDRPATLTVEIVKVLENYKNSAKKLRIIFNNYMDTIEKAGNPRQPDLLGDREIPGGGPVTFLDPLTSAVNDMEALYGKGKVASDLTPTPATRPGNPPEPGLPPGTVKVEPGVLSAGEIIPGDSITLSGKVGTVLEVKGNQVRVRMEDFDPKGSAWVPLDAVELNKAYDTLAQYQKEIGDKIGEITGKLDLDREGVFAVMGRERYASAVSEISVKELLQNAFDAVKEHIYHNKGVKAGNIHVNVNADERSITITDDGIGMTEDIINKGLFTIGGTVKDMPEHLRSGGLGMAKMAIFTCADRVVLETTRNGRTIKLDALAKDIRASNFTPEIFKAAPGAHGTTIKVFIPGSYVDSAGETKRIPFPSSLNDVRTLKYPLLGPVKITVDFTNRFEKSPQETLNKGVNHDAKAMPKITTATFSWGTADIYYGKERVSGYPSHTILSSGIFQFENMFRDKPGWGGEVIPFNIIVDIKSNVAAHDGDYPFELNRESFKPRMVNEINALRTFLHAIARGTEAEDIQANFKNIKSMPRIDFANRGAGESVEAKKALKAANVKATKAPSIPKTIKITEEGAKTANGAFFAQPDNVKAASAKFDTQAPTMDKFLLDMDQPPSKPIFHNNTNFSLDNLMGHPELFFAEMGTIITEMKEKLAASGISGASRLEGLVYSGVSLDKGYCGVAITVPYKAAMFNPLNPIYKSRDLFANRASYYETMVHELAHLFNMVDHGEVHNNNMSQIRGYLAEKGLEQYFKDLIFKSLSTHNDVIQVMRDRYDERTTRNTGKSLESVQTQSRPEEPVGGSEGVGGDALRALQAGRGPGGRGPVPAGVGTGEQGPERSRTGGLSVGARPLSKFEQRLKGILSAYPDADPERVAQALRAAPKMADREIAGLAAMKPGEASGVVRGALTALERAELAKRSGLPGAALFPEMGMGGGGGLFDQAPEAAKPAVPSGVAEFMGKFGTARGAGKPEGLLTGKPAEVAAPAPGPQPHEMPISQFIKASDLEKSRLAPYFDQEGKQIASSREIPAQQSDLPIGSWKIDDQYKGAYGRMIDQLRMIDPNNLEFQEDPYQMGRGEDVKRYKAWAAQGLVPPPITVVETDSGKLRIIDGHRRATAAKEAGVEIPAWVSPASEIKTLDSSTGKPQKVALTHELAIEHAVNKGLPVPPEVLADYGNEGKFGLAPVPGEAPAEVTTAKAPEPTRELPPAITGKPAEPTERWKGNLLEWSAPKSKVPPKTGPGRQANFQDFKGTIKTGEIDDSLPLTDKAMQHWHKEAAEQKPGGFLGYVNMRGLKEEDVRSILSAVRRGEASVTVNRMGKMAFYKLKGELVEPSRVLAVDHKTPLFHGQQVPFEGVKAEAGNRVDWWEGKGFYLTNDPDIAQTYTGGEEGEVSEHRLREGATVLDLSKVPKEQKGLWDKVLTYFIKNTNLGELIDIDEFKDEVKAATDGRQLREFVAENFMTPEEAFTFFRTGEEGKAIVHGMEEFQKHWNDALKFAGVDATMEPTGTKGAVQIVVNNFDMLATVGENHPQQPTLLPPALTGAPAKAKQVMTREEFAAATKVRRYGDKALRLDYPDGTSDYKKQSKRVVAPWDEMERWAIDKAYSDYSNRVEGENALKEAGERAKTEPGFINRGAPGFTGTPVQTRDQKIGAVEKTMTPAERWDSLKLGDRFGFIRESGWVTARGHLTKTGEKILHGDWDTLSPAARNVLTREINKAHPVPVGEFDHLRTATDETTGKVGDRTLKQEVLFSRPVEEGQPGEEENFIQYSRPPEAEAAEAPIVQQEAPVVTEEQQAQLIPGEPVPSLKEFTARLYENDGALLKQFQDPANKMIPLYEGERYLGTRAGDFIETPKGKPQKLSIKDIYERLYNPKTATLPLGTETARPEDLLGTPDEPGPEGTVEKPPGYAGSIIRSVREKFSASNISEKARLAHQFIVEHLGWAAREVKKDAKILDKYSERFGQMTREDLIKFTDAAETGNLDQVAPDLLEAAQAWRRISDGLHSLLVDAKGGESAYWENYFPRLFENPEQAAIAIAAMLKSRGTSLTGPESFNKVRTQLLFSDSIKPVEEGGLGLTPRYPNYVDMMKANIYEKMRFLTGKYIQADLIEAGFITKTKTSGWEPLTGDKTLEGYYAHPDVARVMENFLSKGLRGDPLFELYNSPASFMNTVMVGMSAFHATFSTFSDLAHGIGSNLTRAIGAAVTGRFGLSGHYLAEMAKASNIPANLMRGGKLGAEYAAPGTHPEMSEIVDLMTKAGIRFESPGFKETLSAIFKPGGTSQTEMGEMSKTFAEVAAQQIGVPRKVMEAIAWPIMSYMVPRLKINATARLLQMELDTLVREGKMKDMTPQDLTRMAQEVARKSDNIFGQMVYDNLSMKRGMRDGLRVLIGFPGWNIGSFTDILQAGKGIYHISKQAGGAMRDIATGRKPTWETMSRSDRMSMEFYLGTAMVMAVFGALLQRMLTGDWPEDAKDLFMPRTGELTANGQPERLRAPTYMRDVLSLNHPVTMLKHKLNWPLRMVASLVDNQDFFGTEIRDPYAGAATQAKQVGKYVGKSLLPFGIQGYLATESPKARALNLIGITKVPRLYSNSDAMNVIDEYNKQNRAAITSKEAEAEKNLKGDLRRLAKNQDEDGFREAARAAMEEGTLTRQQVKSIVAESQAPPGLGRFVALPVEWQVRAWAKATDQEKEAWRPYFIKKVMSAKPEILIRNRDILDPTLREMGLDDAADTIQNLKISDKAAAVNLAALGIRQPTGEMVDIDTVDLAMAREIAAQEAKLGTEPKARSKKNKYSFLGIQ